MGFVEPSDQFADRTVRVVKPEIRFMPFVVHGHVAGVETRPSAGPANDRQPPLFGTANTGQTSGGKADLRGEGKEHTRIVGRVHALRVAARLKFV